MLTMTFGALLFGWLKALAARWNHGADASLRDLDDRTLADIGVHRSEIASIEAEWLGRSDTTRLRIVAGALHA